MKQLGLFLAVAFGATWLWWTPALLGLPLPVGLLTAVSMALVALAAFLALRRSGPGADSGLRLPRPHWLLLGLALIPVASLTGIALGWLTGGIPLDLANFSGLRATLAPDTLGQAGVPWALIGQALGTSAVLFLLALPLMWCEEWGWRGFLLPRLLPLGLWPALLGSGLIWAAWHLPIYFLPGAPAPALLPFVVMTTLLGVLFGWLRLVSGSVWPCVLAHGVNNAFAGLFNTLFADAELLRRPDLSVHIGLTSWTGWAALLAVIVVCFAVRGPRLEVPFSPAR